MPQPYFFSPSPLSDFGCEGEEGGGGSFLELSLSEKVTFGDSRT